MRPHRRQPTRLPHPWDSPGKNTGVGCHFLLQCMKVKSENEVAQSCLTPRDPTDCSLPGSSVHGICQARVLEWVAIAFSEDKKLPQCILCYFLPRCILNFLKFLWLWNKYKNFTHLYFLLYFVSFSLGMFSHLNKKFHLKSICGVHYTLMILSIHLSYLWYTDFHLGILFLHSVDI